MIVKRKLYSVMDEEGNQGYYLYNEATGEEKLFSVVEEEQREFARGTGAAVYYAEQMMKNKGNKIANKAAKREYYKAVGLDQFAKNNKRLILNRGARPSNTFEDLKVSIGRSFDPASNKGTGTGVNKYMEYKKPGDIGFNKEVMKSSKKVNEMNKHNKAMDNLKGGFRPSKINTMN